MRIEDISMNFPWEPGTDISTVNIIKTSNVFASNIGNKVDFLVFLPETDHQNLGLSRKIGIIWSPYTKNKN